MINWQVVEQIFSASLVFLAGPGIIVFLALNKGNI